MFQKEALDHAGYRLRPERHEPALNLLSARTKKKLGQLLFSPFFRKRLIETRKELLGSDAESFQSRAVSRKLRRAKFAAKLNATGEILNRRTLSLFFFSFAFPGLPTFRPSCLDQGTHINNFFFPYSVAMNWGSAVLYLPLGIFFSIRAFTKLRSVLLLFLLYHTPLTRCFVFIKSLGDILTAQACLARKLLRSKYAYHFVSLRFLRLYLFSFERFAQTEGLTCCLL